MAEWLKAADCKSARVAYVGSNPTPTTIAAKDKSVSALGNVGNPPSFWVEIKRAAKTLCDVGPLNREKGRKQDVQGTV